MGVPVTWITIGSVAMRAHGIGNREPKDYDAFAGPCAEVPVSTDLKLERFWHDDLWGWFYPDEIRLATLDELYTIKVSHSYWSLRNGSWAKHMYDQEQLRAAGAEMITQLHNILYRIWSFRYGFKKVDLSQDAATFFGPGIRRYYEHDSVHRAVAFYDEPLYTRILRKGAEVTPDPAKLAALDPAARELLWREEIAVLALERTVIPYLEAGAGHGVPPKGLLVSAWRQALKTMITSATKGESAKWLSTHYGVLRNPDDYYWRFFEGRHLLEPKDDTDVAG